MNELTITHTHEAGTLIEGTARGDGSAEVLKANRWRWGRSIGCWYMPHSRDKAAQRYRITATAEALETAGFTVTVEIDDTARPTAEVEAAKAERLAARAEALEAKAERKAAAAEAAEKANRARLNALPEGGEPIKIGHHSERRHRRAIERAHQAMGRSVEADREADRAAAAARTAHAATGARYAPDTVARRIERLQAEERATRRTLDGHTSHRGTPYAHEVPPATGAARERAEADAARIADELNYWQGIRAEQIATGQAGDYSHENIKPGDYVKLSNSWWKVRRANAKTVSVESRGCSTRAPYGTIRDHKTAEEVEADRSKSDTETAKS